MWKPSWQLVEDLRHRRRKPSSGDPQPAPRPPTARAVPPRPSAAPSVNAPAFVEERPRGAASSLGPVAPTPVASGPQVAGSRARRYAPAGQPINRRSPFYMGLVGGFGVLVAYSAWQALASLDTVLTLLVVAVFLTLALNPLVEALVRRPGLSRGSAVFVVCSLGLVLLLLVGVVVVPPVSEQAADLARNAPAYLEQLGRNPTVQELDAQYQVLGRLQEEFNRRITDSSFMSQVFGGVLGVGRAVASGIFSVVTVAVLTLYFLSSLPRLKAAAYAVVPATRRPRVVSLSEEIMRRVGYYAIGQVAVASVNALCSYVVMSILELPYAAVLAVTVGLLGLIPMVGATLGAIVVATVALFDDPKKAIIVVVYFIVYQQAENYLVAPRIMQRTVSVPGGVTIVAALIGGTLLGVVGALLAIPAAAGVLLLYEEVLVPRQRTH